MTTTTAPAPTPAQPARVPITRSTDEGRRIVERILQDVDGITSLDVAAFNSSI